MSINIKGKEYVLVNERLTIFRENYKEWSLITEIIEVSDHKVIMIAKILNPEGKLVATGHAYEMADSSFINKTSYIENCETSAWGRALANLGIGLEVSVASAEEVVNAINNQDNAPVYKVSEKQLTYIRRLIEKNEHLDIPDIVERYKVKALPDLSSKQASELIDLLTNK